MSKHNIIESSKLTPDNPMLEMGDVEPRSFNGWEMQFSNNQIELSIKHQMQIADYAMRGLRNFLTTETTLATERIGMPTAIARVDCTIDRNGDIFAYEVEERPSGLGIQTAANEQFGDGEFGDDVRGHLEQTFGQLPIVRIHPERIKTGKPGDDEFIFGPGMVGPIEYDGDRIIVEPRPTLVRAEPEHIITAPNVGELSAWSIATAVDKGRKDYRAAVNNAYVARGVEQLPPPDQSFVVKSLQSSKTNGVEIWISPADRAGMEMGKSPHGAATRSKIERFVAEHPEGVLVEKFVPGIKTRYNDKGFVGTTALRVFAKVFEDHVETGDGVYMCRPSIMIHGARDAITGYITSPERVAVYE